MIREFIERRTLDRRRPSVYTASPDTVDAAILASRYTGPAIVEYRNGVRQEIKIAGEPLSIRLDNRARQADSSIEHEQTRIL